jgi:hypothetical protein
MKFYLQDQPTWNTIGGFLIPLAAALIFLFITFSYYPFREKFQFNTDEGLNLMRSMLVVMGYPLYSEVSSDQPPLFTLILGVAFRVAGFDVNLARVLVLLFSALLVWAASQFLLLASGKLSAILFLPLALIIPRYMELSVSVMIGVPSIALALVSVLFITAWHKKKKDLWLILSAITLVCSVLIKLFTGFLAPIILVGIIISAYNANNQDGFSWKTLRPALIWGGCFAGMGLLLGLTLVGTQNIDAIISPHLSANTADEFQSNLFAINPHLETTIPLIAFGIWGALVCIFKRNWLLLYPLAWSSVIYILLNFHSPVFYHHQLLVTIPVAILGAAGTGEGIKSIFNPGKHTNLAKLHFLLGTGALISFVLTINHYIPALDKELMDTRSIRFMNTPINATAGRLRVLQTMEEYVGQTKWIVTDMPMYAFRVHLPVPPLLATFSEKRLVTGNLTEEEIIATMRKYNPEQVFMARFVIPPLETYLEGHYNLVVSDETFRLFIRKDLIK